MNLLAAARDAMVAVNPQLPWVALTAVIWVTQWVLRCRAPKAWTLLFSWLPDDSNAVVRATLMGLPSVVVGAALPALAAGGDLNAAVKGAIFGALAPAWHHILKAMPGPYQGALGVSVAKKAPGGDVPLA